MNNRQTDQLNQLMDVVLESSKYRGVTKDFVRTVGSVELSKRRKLKEAIKATKNKLHQVGGAFLDKKPAFAEWLERLRATIQMGDKNDLRRVCSEIMAHHSSTRERLPIIHQFYEKTLADLSPIHSVLDIACGLNPLSIPWMPLAEQVEYHAYDIYETMIDFLSEFMTLVNVRGHAEARDVLQPRSMPHVDVALILKAVPCLEQIEKSAGRQLLDATNADHVLVSFPVHTLGGRKKGMAANYEARFRELIAGTNRSITRFVFETELVFRLSK